MAGAVEFCAYASRRAGCYLLFWFGGEPWDGFSTLTCCRCATAYGELWWNSDGVDDDCLWHANGDLNREAGHASYAVSTLFRG